MKGKNKIKEEYRKGDLEKRLNLFLSHRSLRKEFADIDKRKTLISQQNEFPSLQEAA